MFCVHPGAPCYYFFELNHALQIADEQKIILLSSMQVRNCYAINILRFVRKETKMLPGFSDYLKGQGSKVLLSS
jgi:hypothetical protein